MSIKRAARAFVVGALLMVMLAVQPAAAQRGGANLECSLNHPYVCVGRYVEIVDFNGRSLVGRVYGIIVAGEGFNLDGHFVRGSVRDEITIWEQRTGEAVTLDLASVAALRDIDTVPLPTAAHDVGLDLLLLVSAVLLLVLVVVLARQEWTQRAQLQPAARDGETWCEAGQPADSRAHSVVQADALAFLEAEPPLPAAFGETRVATAALREAALPIDEVTYLAIGGGMGSFAWVDCLRICGAAAEQIMVIGTTARPYDVYRRLCHASQVSDNDRLRSDSGATPDNLWGWPGYALRESWHELRCGRIGAALLTLWRVFAETALAEPYTPRAGDVFKAIDREAKRINWHAIQRTGLVECLRKTDDGRYVAIYAHYDGARWSRRAALAHYVHIATGCAGPRLLPELLNYRTRTGDCIRAVHAYEEHDHIYAQLAERGGTVLLRGRGITAAAVLEKLAVAQAHNPHVRVLHLMRTPLPSSAHVGRASRPVLHHWTLQPYNWPKSAFGGTWQVRLERASAAERRYLLSVLSGVTTPPRRAFVRLITQGLREGWYQVYMGTLSQLDSENGSLLAGVRDLRGEPAALFAVDYVIDATGLDTEVSSSALLSDLVRHYGLALNTWNKLDVTRDFELAQMRNDGGRVFAAGSITAGGFYAPVDSFLGLQFAALRSADALARLGAPGVSRLNGWRSFNQWLRWARGKQP